MQFIKRHLYDPIWKAIIRPPRQKYNPYDLGCRIFNYMGRTYERNDFEVLNSCSEKLQCSYFHQQRTQLRPCIIYLHGNSASRLSGYRVIKTIFPLEVDLVCFDFSGCGLSEGEYVTLGKKEMQDLKSVLSHMEKHWKIRQFIIWGRSMGAVTALLYQQEYKNPAVKALILDSPFASLKDLVYEIADRYLSIIPTFLVDIILANIAQTILQLSGLDFMNHGPIARIKECKCPVLFIAGLQDQLVDKSHSERLYEHHSGQKKIMLCKAGHNDDRPKFIMEYISFFIKKKFHLQVDPAPKKQSSETLQNMIKNTQKIQQASQEKARVRLEEIRATALQL